MARVVVQAAAAACIIAALEDASDVFPGLLTRIDAPRVYFYVVTYFFTLSLFFSSPLFFSSLRRLFTFFSPLVRLFIIYIIYIYYSNNFF